MNFRFLNPLKNVAIAMILFTGAVPLFAEKEKLARVVIAIAEPGYKTEVTLPALAKKIWTKERGYEVTVIVGDTKKHNLVGLADALKTADVLVLSVRRQALPAAQLQAFRDYLAAGKPLLAIRTTSHGFTALGKGPAGHVDWDGFGAEVLGAAYRIHQGNEFTGTFTAAPEEGKHEILAGVELPFSSGGGMYFSKAHAKTTTPILMGKLKGHAPEPVAWTNKYGKSHVFYTSLGQEEEFAQAAFQKLMSNAMEWLLARSAADKL